MKPDRAIQIPDGRTASDASGTADGSDLTLKRSAITAFSSMVIGMASTAPAYAIAATLGFVVAVSAMGAHAPAVMIVGFVPMFFIAVAYKAMNRADPDCGQAFSWITRAFGPTTGWTAGWVMLFAFIIVNAGQADFAGIYTFQLLGLNGAANSTVAVTVLGVCFIVGLTWICYVGIELSARTQRILLGFEVSTLVLFSIVALVKVYTGHPAHAAHPSLGWFNPFSLGSTPLLLGVLLAVFLYWGWDTGVSVNEETERAATGPGSAAVASTVLLLLIVLLVTVAAQAFAGTAFLANPRNSSDVFAGSLGRAVLGGALAKVLTLALISSALAATQTSILPGARTALSMARRGAIPIRFGEIHPVHRTPGFATLVVGALSVAWFVLIVQVSTNVLSDSVTGIGFMICFYYGFTGFSCTWFHRRELGTSMKNFVSLGLLPTLGGLALIVVFVKSFLVYKNPANDVSKPLLGIGVPVWIGVGLLVVGFVLALAVRPYYPRFFGERTLMAGNDLQATTAGASAVRRTGLDGDVG